MELVIRSEHGEAEVTVTGATSRLGAGELVAHVLGGNAPSTVWIDGRPTPGAIPIDEGLAVVGSVLEATAPASADADPLVVVSQVAGFGAGTQVVLSQGSVLVGPSRRVNLDDLAIAPVDEPVVQLSVGRAGEITVSRPDGPSRGDVAITVDGTELTTPTSWVSGPLVADDRVFVYRPYDPHGLDGPDGGRITAPLRGRIVHERAPRIEEPPNAAPIVVPSVGRSTRRRRAERAAIRSNFERSVANARRADERRARRRHPHLGEVLATIDGGGPALWARRMTDSDALHVSLGLADQPWRPELHHEDDALTDAASTIAEAGPLRTTPIVADLRHERGLAIVGATDEASDVARAVLLSLCVTHGPADLDVVVITSAARRPMWEWTKWLPHVSVDGTPAILSDPAETARWVTSYCGADDASATTLVIADEPDAWRDRDAPLRAALATARGRIRLLALSETAQDAPAACTTLVLLGADPTAATHVDGTPSVSVESAMTGRRVDDVAPAAITESVALRAARRLAGFDDADRPAARPIASDSTAATADLEPRISPYVVGRRPGPLETRLLRDAIASGPTRRPPTRPDRRPRERRRATVTVGDSPADTWTLGRGTRALVLGPSSSGRSQLLARLAESARSADPDLDVFAVAPRGGPLRGAVDDPTIDMPGSPHEVAAWVDRILAVDRERLVLVDDADRLGGPSMERLAAHLGSDTTIVLAGRPAVLGDSRHWSGPLLPVRDAVLLGDAVPNERLIDLDASAPSARADHQAELLLVASGKARVVATGRSAEAVRAG